MHINTNLLLLPLLQYAIGRVVVGIGAGLAGAR
jgi:hypothetical protein